MFQIIGAMAEFERALIQERVRAGLRNARAKGIISQPFSVMQKKSRPVRRLGVCCDSRAGEQPATFRCSALTVP